MVRTKGCNSDYVFDAKSGAIQEQGKDQPVYLKIFVCPNDMPSHVEPPHNGKWCQGTDPECPDPKQDGHALICLHQKNGIEFVSQKGIAAKGAFKVQPNGSRSVLEVDKSGLTITAPVTLQPSAAKEVQITISPEGIVLQTAGGTSVTINNDSIEITSGQGGVKIKGNVEIDGDLIVTKQVIVAGQPLPTAL